MPSLNRKAVLLGRVPYTTRFPHLVFAEALRTLGANVVEPSSADPGIPGVLPIAVDADHFDVCKPPVEEDVRVSSLLQLAEKVIDIQVAKNNEMHPLVDQAISILRSMELSLEAGDPIDQSQVTMLQEALSNLPEEKTKILGTKIRQTLSKDLDAYAAIPSGLGQAIARTRSIERKNLQETLLNLSSLLRISYNVRTS